MCKGLLFGQIEWFQGLGGGWIGNHQSQLPAVEAALVRRINAAHGIRCKAKARHQSLSFLTRAYHNVAEMPVEVDTKIYIEILDPHLALRHSHHLVARFVELQGSGRPGIVCPFHACKGYDAEVSAVINRIACVEAPWGVIGILHIGAKLLVRGAHGGHAQFTQRGWGKRHGSFKIYAPESHLTAHGKVPCPREILIQPSGRPPWPGTDKEAIGPWRRYPFHAVGQYVIFYGYRIRIHQGVGHCRIFTADRSCRFCLRTAPSAANTSIMVAENLFIMASWGNRLVPHSLL